MSNQPTNKEISESIQLHDKKYRKWIHKSENTYAVSYDGHLCFYANFDMFLGAVWTLYQYHNVMALDNAHYSTPKNSIHKGRYGVIRDFIEEALQKDSDSYPTFDEDSCLCGKVIDPYSYISEQGRDYCSVDCANKFTS